ncbi:MAG: glycosyltransferase family 2 protein, partial [Nitrospirae bacterium]|nr:glycosyltransferase family 2 protein [Nitrospirota bacterium]
MKVSVIIPVYNRADLLPSVIKALLGQEYPAEIIIVDDGSTDSTAEAAKGYPVKYIYQENAGPAKARNTGWKASTGEIVCFTDSDCIPRKDWAGRLAESFVDDSIGAVGGSYDIAYPESLLSRCIHEEIKLRHFKLGA